jgi:hypothetical protein
MTRPEWQAGLLRQFLGKAVRFVAVVHLVKQVNEITILVDGVDVPPVWRIGYVDFEANGFGADLSHGYSSANLHHHPPILIASGGLNQDMQMKVLLPMPLKN